MFRLEKDSSIEQAFAFVDRRGFVLPHMDALAYDDAPLAIGHGQTISQPTTVKYMLYWLDIQPGQKILDVGSGSGWTSALLTCMTGETGSVFAVERIPELKAFGERNCAAYHFPNLHFFDAGSEMGLPQQAPFDRILVSAAASREIPQALIDQLAPDGKLVIPVDHSVYELKKSTDGGEEYRKEHYGFSFVPLIEL